MSAKAVAGLAGKQGPPGLAGANGSNGVPGERGPAGATGPAGSGAAGAQGPTGATGSQGAAGDEGRTILSGASNPTGGVGSNGDFYINTATSTLFGPKTSGAWPSGVSLIGTTGQIGATGPTGPAGPTGPTGANGTNGSAGVDGRTILSGASNPTGGIGSNGDFYINTATSTLFGPKASGAWPNGVSLVGAQGSPGIAGTGAQHVIDGNGATLGDLIGATDSMPTGTFYLVRINSRIWKIDSNGKFSATGGNLNWTSSNCTGPPIYVWGTSPFMRNSGQMHTPLVNVFDDGSAVAYDVPNDLTNMVVAAGTPLYYKYGDGTCHGGFTPSYNEYGTTSLTPVTLPTLVPPLTIG